METLADHLERRNFPLVFHPDTVLNHEERTVTFPLWDLSGRMTGYQQYRPDSKDKKSNNKEHARYYTHNDRWKSVMWGTNTIQWNKPFIFVQEGVFDACPFHHFNIPAVAILSYNNVEAYKALRSTGKKLFTIADGDKSGRKLLKTISDGRWLGYSDYHDVSDIPLGKLFQMILYTLRGN